MKGHLIKALKSLQDSGGYIEISDDKVKVHVLDPEQVKEFTETFKQLKITILKEIKQTLIIKAQQRNICVYEVARPLADSFASAKIPVLFFSEHIQELVCIAPSDETKAEIMVREKWLVYSQSELPLLRTIFPHKDSLRLVNAAVKTFKAFIREEELKTGIGKNATLSS